MTFASLLRRPGPTRLALKVTHRNADVALESWWSDFLPPTLEPLLYLGAIGFGLGLFIQDVEGLPYALWFGPALLATTCMFTSFFECAFGSFVRMHYQKTYDAITATPVSLDDVILGELLWGATKATLHAAVVLVVLTLFRVPQSPLILFALPIVFVAAFSFASIGLLTTSVASTFNAFNFPLYLYVTPMFLPRGTFTPPRIFAGQPVLPFAAYMLPLTHAVAAVRALSLGTFGLQEVYHVAWLAFVGFALAWFSINSMTRRLIR